MIIGGALIIVAAVLIVTALGVKIYRSINHEKRNTKRAEQET